MSVKVYPGHATYCPARWYPRGTTNCCCQMPEATPKPWRDPCVFGGAMVGSDPVPLPVDPLPDVKAHYKAGGRVECSWQGGPWRETQDPQWSEESRYRIRVEQAPAPVDPYAHLREALRAGKTVEFRDGERWVAIDMHGSTPATRTFGDTFEYRIKPEPIAAPVVPDLAARIWAAIPGVIKDGPRAVRDALRAEGIGEVLLSEIVHGHGVTWKFQMEERYAQDIMDGRIRAQIIRMP